MLVALIEHLGGQQRNQSRHGGKGIRSPLGIGDMALRAAHGEARIERAATADLYRVAGAYFRRRLADDAMVEPFALLGEPGEYFRGAVGRDAFFIAGDEQADRTIRLAAFDVTR